MDRIRRATIASLVICLLGQTTTLLASDEAPAARELPVTHLTLNGEPLAHLGTVNPATVQAFGFGPRATSSFEASAFGQYRRRGRYHRDAAAAALVLGAVGTIAGAAVLVYANRPDCSVNANLGGCGYGAKVVGGSVLTAGLVGLTIGAITW